MNFGRGQFRAAINPLDTSSISPFFPYQNCAFVSNFRWFYYSGKSNSRGPKLSKMVHPTPPLTAAPPLTSNNKTHFSSSSSSPCFTLIFFFCRRNKILFLLFFLVRRGVNPREKRKRRKEILVMGLTLFLFGIILKRHFIARFLSRLWNAQFSFFSFSYVVIACIHSTFLNFQDETCP